MYTLVPQNAANLDQEVEVVSLNGQYAL